MEMALWSGVQKSRAGEVEVMELGWKWKPWRGRSRDLPEQSE